MKVIELWLYWDCCRPVTHCKGMYSESDNDRAVVIQGLLSASDPLKRYA